MRRLWPGALLPLLLLAGCHSATVVATLHNGTSASLPLLEVDYPSASFGTQNLAPGADFTYRFKIQGTGGLKLIYTDHDGKEHTERGPEVKENSEGTLLIEVSPTGVHWQPKLAIVR